MWRWRIAMWRWRIAIWRWRIAMWTCRKPYAGDTSHMKVTQAMWMRRIDMCRWRIDICMPRISIGMCRRRLSFARWPTWYILIVCCVAMISCMWTDFLWKIPLLHIIINCGIIVTRFRKERATWMERYSLVNFQEKIDDQRKKMSMQRFIIGEIHVCKRGVRPVHLSTTPGCY